ncbi:uncharacterized protein LOC119673236 [Teleopsis dalmanni]|uniref:uncharacterized protein LOC119673236 n=1 Tax=Teleopsis dalmanni TaxID=139649 RepID=UPI0018CD5A30|nr:uncharacterized protein LOC119673236 [Teleopsis dalmanni]
MLTLFRNFFHKFLLVVYLTDNVVANDVYVPLEVLVPKVITEDYQLIPEANMFSLRISSINNNRYEKTEVKDFGKRQQALFVSGFYTSFHPDSKQNSLVMFKAGKDGYSAHFFINPMFGFGGGSAAPPDTAISAKALMSASG